jgi:hypothetical protein
MVGQISTLTNVGATSAAANVAAAKQQTISQNPPDEKTVVPNPFSARN